MSQIKLITVGLSDYSNMPGWKIEEAASSRAAIEDALRRHGIAVEDWTSEATKTGIGQRLESWAKLADESQIVYWVGHGEYSDNGYHLALADSDSPLHEENSLAGARLRTNLRNRIARRTDASGDGWVLLLLDTCGSFEGSWEIYRNLNPRPSNVGVIGTTRGGAAFAGTFSQEFVEELTGFTGNDTDGIPLRELVRRLEDSGFPVNQNFAATVRLPLPFDVPPPTQAPLDIYAELQTVLDEAPPEVRNHFYAKAQGAEIGESAWHFSGRANERRVLSAWLRAEVGGMFVVTGIAGAGKSALLGMILASADDNIGKGLAKLRWDPIPDDQRPVGVTFDAVVHLRGLTVTDTIEILAGKLGLGGISAVDALIAAVRKRATATFILADALDESRDPMTIAALLRQLALIPDVRVLIGTRQSLHEDPDIPTPPDRDVLDALDAQPGHTLTIQRDAEAVRRYVDRRLQQPDDRRLGMLAARVAELIASYDEPFLFARLAVHEIIADPNWATSMDRMTQLLGGKHRGIFARAVQRLAANEPEAEALLHALTYARGSGFPRTGGIWAIAGSAFGDGPFNDNHVAKVLKVAAPYIMHDSEFGQGVYRLAHRTFVEHYLRSDRSSTNHGAMTARPQTARHGLG
jgi:ABC-type uncharacterized transport system YnjBCD ATPase subunit